MKKYESKVRKSTARRLLATGLVAIIPLAGTAQRLLTLDSCRAMALHNNKQMRVAEAKQDVAANLRRSARTKYLPHVSAVGMYEHTSREVSLLNDEQKTTLPQIGTATAGTLQQSMQGTLAQLPTQTLTALGQMGLTPEVINQMAGQGFGQIAGVLNNVGQGIVDALDTDTRNLWAGSILLTQPLFMGGAIVAANKMADLQEQMAANSAEARRQTTIYDIDRAYWQVVSLYHKKQLAQSYCDVVKKLDSDVGKMISEGVATKSDGLSVSVKVNEAEMALLKVSDGLTLSKMLLCQLCGLPVDEQIVLADEEAPEASPSSPEREAPEAPLSSPEAKAPLSSPEAKAPLSSPEGDTIDMSTSKTIEAPSGAVGGASVGDAFVGGALRPELRLLQNTVDLAHQSTNLLKAGNLPQLALTGGYAVSNPNVLNGFQKKFGGFWHVGLTLRVPLWNWGDVMYKVRASKGAAAIANLELEEARELIDLQISQSSFRVDEANKKLVMAHSNIERAEENLRTANIGFKEGVITPTTVMEAQTAWLQAQSQVIDAEIDVRLSHVELQKALGTLTP